MTEIRLCPGWKGNRFNCGRGAPRSLRPGQDVCDSCGRSMRAAGERSIADQRRRRAEWVSARDRAIRGAAIVRERVGSNIRIDRTAVETMERMMRSETAPHGESWYYDSTLPDADRWEIIRALAGMAPAHEPADPDAAETADV